MDLLERMRRTLARGPAPVVLDYPLDELSRQERQLHKQIRERRVLSPDSDLIEEAVERFRRTRRLANSREAKYVAFGALQPVGRKKVRLIEEDELFAHLLDGVKDFLPQPLTFQGCYQGLLHAYLHYQPDATSSESNGRPNWELLRRWLRTHVADIRQDEGVEEAWVTTVAENPDLFSVRPVDRFGEAELTGNREPFATFRHTLGIEDSSWTVDQLVFAQVRAAANSSRTIFLHYVPMLLRMIGQEAANNKRLFNGALGEVLTHYHEVSPTVAHRELQDFTVLHWGNPWLKRNNSGWAAVDEPVRRMVSSWLKLHYIQHFFSVLAQEGKSDPRRLKFWEKYYEAVGSVTFALGPQTRWSTDPDMVKARKLMDGLIVELQGSGASNNNAFIMQFGDWVVVEFGQKGNACFFFKASELPFDPGRDVSVPDVKNHIQRESENPRDPVRRTHRDLIEASWETIFERVLGARGIYPGKTATTFSTVTSQTTRPFTRDAVRQVETRSTPVRHDAPRPLPGQRPTQSREQVAPAKPAVEGRNRSYEQADGLAAEPRDVPSRHLLTDRQEVGIRVLCDRLGIQCQDLRAKNGNLWVFHDQPRDPRITPQLQEWGFQYRAGKGWWYKKPD